MGEASSGSAGDAVPASKDSTGISTDRAITQALSSEAAESLAALPGSEAGKDLYRYWQQAEVPANLSLKITDGDQDPTGIVEPGRLDTSKSLSQLTAERLIIDKQDPAKRIEGGDSLKASSLKVKFSRPADLSSKQPDFVIKEDGSIEMHRNPEVAGKGEITIGVERRDGQLLPALEQAEALDALVRYLSDRSKITNPAAARDGLQLKDSQGLVSESTRQGMPARKGTKLERLPEPTRRQVERMNRFPGSGRGTMPRAEADTYFPPREVPVHADETENLVSLKETVAAIFNPDRARPYETVRRSHDGSYRVGRYGFNFSFLMFWMEEQLGDPPDYSKLPDLMKMLAGQGRIPKGFAAKFEDPKFAARFASFMDRLKGQGAAISAADLKEFLPKELQESVASDLIKGLNQETGGDPAKTALSLHLGKRPAEFSQDDLNKPENKEIMAAARRLHGLAEVRQKAGKNDSITWVTDGSPGSEVSFKLASAAGRVASVMNRTGRCAEGVQRALARAGMPEFLGSGNAWDMLTPLKRSGKFVEVDLSRVKAGDIMLRRTPGYYGHIAVITKRDGSGLYEASDHHGKVNLHNRRYDKTVFLRAVRA